ncbi:uncharacterized protein AMSG_12147 [Thecamonas trahens ATCC 50062]|uniref:SAC domain-containing protein n=1 Tax=Thecamonas trahens ATCC 50062 TaxID=461836 RepID=A0A0L0DIM5_THETB|nr:hypothetical protein AMSG_12147 [Thecamonas trahens ATCC 50062]KNC51956.1 hypothetical protein AMSG_12147 [Thecamonas trahens ATCC 50062]|eukprot:XP_013755632.1 hypothetical protein AMSG_12147 [Thecamonas trahens ATCC 50062]
MLIGKFDVYVESNAVRPEVGNRVAAMTCLAVVGLVPTPLHTLLVMVAEAKHVGTLLGAHHVYAVERVVVLPVGPPQIAFSGSTKQAARIEAEVKKVLESGGVYYSHTYDLSLRLEAAVRFGFQPHAGDASANRSVSWKVCHPEMVWNFAATAVFREAGADRWIVPMIHGFVGFVVGTKIGSAWVDLALISRRSTNRAGVRYHRRGIDDNGHVANAVETEQVVHVNAANRVGAAADDQAHVFSFVLLRGSIPLFWTQGGPGDDSLKPKARLARTLLESYEAMRHHFDDLTREYGRVATVNLVNKGGHEGGVGSAFETLLAELPGNESWLAAQLWFDFHDRGFDAIPSDVIGPLDSILLEMGYTWALPDPQLPLCSSQAGVIRVNCMDCLDRTNVVQSLLAKHVLALQLARIGIEWGTLSSSSGSTAGAAGASFADPSPPPRPASTVPPPSKPLPRLPGNSSSKPLPPSPRGMRKTMAASAPNIPLVEGSFLDKFYDTWTQNADAIAKQYTGTGAMKTNMLKSKGRSLRGLLKDGMTSVGRMYKGAFIDSYRQAAIDMLLGYPSLPLDELASASAAAGGENAARPGDPPPLLSLALIRGACTLLGSSLGSVQGWELSDAAGRTAVLLLTPTGLGFAAYAGSDADFRAPEIVLELGLADLVSVHGEPNSDSSRYMLRLTFSGTRDIESLELTAPAQIVAEGLGAQMQYLQSISRTFAAAGVLTSETLATGAAADAARAAASGSGSATSGFSSSVKSLFRKKPKLSSLHGSRGVSRVNAHLARALKASAAATDSVSGASGSRPLISIVITTHNNNQPSNTDASETEISELIASLVGQRVGGLRATSAAPGGQAGIGCEVIFVDDGSDDGTAAELDGSVEALKAAGYANVVVVPRGLSCGSPACGRNMGAALAAGEWLLCLDGDDMLPEGTIGRYVEAVAGSLLEGEAESKQTNVVLGGHVLVGETGWVDELGIDHRWRCEPYSAGGIYAANSVPSHALVHRTLWQAAGGYNELLPSLEDWIYWWAVQEVADVALECIEGNTLDYRQHARSGSRNAGSVDMGPYVRAAMATMAPTAVGYDAVAAAVALLRTAPASFEATWFNPLLVRRPRERAILLWRALGRLGRGDDAAGLVDALAAVAGTSTAGPHLGLDLLALDVYCTARESRAGTGSELPRCSRAAGYPGWLLRTDPGAPAFDADFEFSLNGDFERIRIIVWDAFSNKHRPTYLGELLLSERAMMASPEVKDWFPIYRNPMSDGVLVTGEVLLDILYEPEACKISVTVARAVDLAAQDTNGLSDPYVKLVFGKVKKQSEVQKMTLNPVYNTTFELKIKKSSPRSLTLSFWDWDLASADDFMGQVKVFSATSPRASAASGGGFSMGARRL